MNYSRGLFPHDVYVRHTVPPFSTAADPRQPPVSYPGPPMAAPEDISPFFAALLTSVLAGTTTLGKNLRRAENGEMTVREAVVRALGEGAVTTFSTTVAAGVTSALDVGPIARLLIFAGTATGISYGLSAAAEYVPTGAGSRATGIT
ncbi:hypothetical protein [Desulfonema ishimotonii]|uniref:hypothetical protein n=1 Tax=Desulfonema ishimotonii TaxID=45657 RepID=UPI000F56C712|nr:hypothetical protein [Desulfonema ishimotonii]